MINLEADVVISRPVAEVFAHWTDFEHAPDWADRAIERRKLTEGPLGVGTKYRTIDQYPGRRVESTMEVTAYEPNGLLAAVWSRPVPGRWEARFAESDGGTRLSVTAEIRPSGAIKLFSPVVRPWAKREMMKTLHAFKARVERGEG